MDEKQAVAQKAAAKIPEASAAKPAVAAPYKIKAGDIVLLNAGGGKTIKAKTLEVRAGEDIVCEIAEGAAKGTKISKDKGHYRLAW